MVAMAEPRPASINGHDKEGAAVEAVEELIAEFGVRGFLGACLHSTAGDEIERLGSNATLRIAQVIIREIAFSKHPQLEAEVMALGSGIILGDADTMTAIAAKHGFSKQALSKRVVAYCDENKLPPSQFMRARKDRVTYSLANKPRQT
jgi:hypothetical protein